MMMVSLQQQQQIHHSHSQTKPSKLQQVSPPRTFPTILQQMPPDVGGDVEEVAGYKHQDVGLGGMVEAGDGQPDQHSHDRNEVDGPVADERLPLAELVLHEDGHVPDFPGDFVGHDGHEHRQELLRVPGGEGHSDGQSIQPVVQQGADQVQVPC